MKNIGTCLLIFTILSSCSRSKDNTENLAVEKDWQLTKVDSIQIPFLGTPQLHDVDPKNRTMVFMQSGESEEEVFVANFDGEILHSFKAHGNTQVGFLRLTAPYTV
jgi:hypothetical protein